MEDRELILFCLTLFLGALTLINFFVSRRKEAADGGEEKGNIKSDILSIKNMLIDLKSDTAEIKRQQTEQGTQIARLEVRVNNLEQNIKRGSENE